MRELRLQWLLLLICVGYIHAIGLQPGLHPGNWPSCGMHLVFGRFMENERSPSMTNTMSRVEELRSVMRQKTLGTYIVPAGDAHLSEFTSDHDKRRQYISGFSGSSGTAVITLTRVALWTDGRYFLQAEAELGCDWILMREGEAGVPSITEWIAEELGSGNGSKSVGACPFFFGNDDWLGIQDALDEAGSPFYPVQPDLVDVIWDKEGQHRPPFPSTVINALPLKYAGVLWQTKVADVQQEMKNINADMLVISGLDETAWLFNMRATDIRGFVNDPFFYSVAIVRPDSDIVKLYIKDGIRKLSEDPTDPATDVLLKDHLNVNENGTCAGRGGLCVEVNEYEWMDILDYLKHTSSSGAVNRVWLSYHASYAIFATIPQNKVYVRNTPVSMMKVTKNDVEVEGMKNAHVRDAVALARFMALLESEVEHGNWTEVSAMNELARYRRMQALNRGDSFIAISSVGPHAAINHYFATNETDRPITTTETYLLDSGGQYLDGTTDVTRTFLFRDPTDFEKECYTRVLMGQIDLATAKWNKGLYGREIDAFARAPLWDVGLVYRHGTGHGIGAYLSVHEGPARISNYHNRFVWDVPLEEHMFFSDEPGYYQDGKFGIRLENIVYVTKAETKYTFPGATILEFVTITLFPYELHMIDLSMLSDDQLSWLDDYNQRVMNALGPVLVAQQDERAYQWVKRRTRPIRTGATSSAGRALIGQIVLLCVVIASTLVGGGVCC